jgi:hypothetical protein
MTQPTLPEKLAKVLERISSTDYASWYSCISDPGTSCMPVSYQSRHGWGWQGIYRSIR